MASRVDFRELEDSTNSVLSLATTTVEFLFSSPPSVWVTTREHLSQPLYQVIRRNSDQYAFFFRHHPDLDTLG